MANAVLIQLREKRDEQISFIDQLTARAAADNDGKGRELVKSELDNLRSARDLVKQLDEQIEPLAEFDELRGAHADTAARFTGTGGGESRDASRGDRLGVRTNDREYEYRSAGEFMRDVALVRSNHSGEDAAAGRLRSVGVEQRDGLIRAAAPHNTTDEVPGLLPVRIVGQIMSDIDAARPFISSVGAKDLGGIPGKSFERPVITQHVAVGKQETEKSDLANRQFKVGGVPFMKDTFGGWANVSRQSIDWTSPGVWDALLTDFVEQYGLETEEAAAAAFVASVTQTTPAPALVEGDPNGSTRQMIGALYAAAATSYAGVRRLPDTVWASLDMWQQLGTTIDHLRATSPGDGAGSSSHSSFAGNLLQTNRVVVPSFPPGTLIVGVKNRTEVYEDRIGFLSAIEPKVLGIELAYGGYMAAGTVQPKAFTKVAGL